jgi:hypothetical protein
VIAEGAHVARGNIVIRADRSGFTGRAEVLSGIKS